MGENRQEKDGLTLTEGLTVDRFPLQLHHLQGLRLTAHSWLRRHITSLLHSLRPSALLYM